MSKILFTDRTAPLASRRGFLGITGTLKNQSDVLNHGPACRLSPRPHTSQVQLHPGPHLTPIFIS